MLQRVQLNVNLTGKYKYIKQCVTISYFTIFVEFLKKKKFQKMFLLKIKSWSHW